MTYAELKAFLDTLTDAQLNLPATTYSGEIDDTIGVIGTAFNTKKEMGARMEGFKTSQPFILIG
jgi:hypothetical protein